LGRAGQKQIEFASAGKFVQFVTIADMIIVKKDLRYRHGAMRPSRHFPARLSVAIHRDFGERRFLERNSSLARRQ